MDKKVYYDISTRQFNFNTTTPPGFGAYMAEGAKSLGSKAAYALGTPGRAVKNAYLNKVDPNRRNTIKFTKQLGGYGGALMGAFTGYDDAMAKWEAERDYAISQGRQPPPPPNRLASMFLGGAAGMAAGKLGGAIFGKKMNNNGSSGFISDNLVTDAKGNVNPWASLGNVVKGSSQQAEDAMRQAGLSDEQIASAKSKFGNMFQDPEKLQYEALKTRLDEMKPHYNNMTKQEKAMYDNANKAATVYGYGTGGMEGVNTNDLRYGLDSMYEKYNPTQSQASQTNTGAAPQQNVNQAARPVRNSGSAAAFNTGSPVASAQPNINTAPINQPAAAKALRKPSYSVRGGSVPINDEMITAYQQMKKGGASPEQLRYYMGTNMGIDGGSDGAIHHKYEKAFEKHLTYNQSLADQKKQERAQAKQAKKQSQMNTANTVQPQQAQPQVDLNKVNNIKSQVNNGAVHHNVPVGGQRTIRKPIANNGSIHHNAPAGRQVLLQKSQANQPSPDQVARQQALAARQKDIVRQRSQGYDNIGTAIMDRANLSIRSDMNKLKAGASKAATGIKNNVKHDVGVVKNNLGLAGAYANDFKNKFTSGPGGKISGMLNKAKNSIQDNINTGRDVVNDVANSAKKSMGMKTSWGNNYNNGIAKREANSASKKPAGKPTNKTKNFSTFTPSFTDKLNPANWVEKAKINSIKNHTAKITKKIDKEIAPMYKMVGQKRGLDVNSMRYNLLDSQTKRMTKKFNDDLSKNKQLKMFSSDMKKFFDEKFSNNLSGIGATNIHMFPSTPPKPVNSALEPKVAVTVTQKLDTPTISAAASKMQQKRNTLIDLQQRVMQTDDIVRKDDLKNKITNTQNSINELAKKNAGIV